MSIIRSGKKIHVLIAAMFATAGVITLYALALRGQNQQFELSLVRHCSYTGTSFGFRTRECGLDLTPLPDANDEGRHPKISYVLAGWEGEPASNLYLASGEKSVVAGPGQVMAMGIPRKPAKVIPPPDGMPVDFIQTVSSLPGV